MSDPTAPRRLNLLAALILLRKTVLFTAPALGVVVLAICLLPYLWLPVVPDARMTDGYHDGQRGDLQALVVTHAFAIVGMEQGAAVLDRETGLWRYYTQRNTRGGLLEDNVKQVMVDPQNGRFLFRTQTGGLADAAANLGGWRALYPLSPCPAPAGSWRVATLLEAPDAPGHVWLIVGTDGHGLCLYDASTKLWSKLDAATSEAALPADRVFDLLFLVDRRRLLAATAAGLAEFRVDVSAAAPLTPAGVHLKDRSVRRLDPTGQGRGSQLVTALTEAGGIAFRLADDTWKSFIGDRGFRASNAPRVSIARWDEQHQLLIVGTDEVGWDVYDARARDWLGLGTGFGKRVYDIAQFNGEWWVGTNQGLHVFAPGPSTAPLKVENTGMASAKRLSVDGTRLFALSETGDVKVFHGRETSKTLIDATPCNEARGTPVGVVVFNGHLWLALDQGTVVVYDSAVHALRSSPVAKPPRVVNQLVRSDRRLWCLAGDRPDGPFALYRLDGDQPNSQWRREQAAKALYTQAQPFGAGLLALAQDGSLWHIHDDLSAPTVYFSGAGADLATAPWAAAVGAEKTIHLARSSVGDRQLLTYQAAFGTWSQTHLASDIKQLTYQRRQLFITTHNGGVCLADGEDPWVIQEDCLLPDDAKNPQILDAARLSEKTPPAKGNAVYCILASGQLYRHAARGAWQTVHLQQRLGGRAMPPFREIEAINDWLLLRGADGSLVWHAPEHNDSVRWLEGGLGARPTKVLLAVRDQHDLLWVLTDDGIIGAYHLPTHHWQKTHQLGGNGPHQLRSWGRFTLANKTTDAIWITTNQGSATFFSGGKSEPIALVSSGLVQTAMEHDDQTLCLLVATAEQEGRRQALQFISIGDRSLIRQEPLPPGVQGVALAKDVPWVRTPQALAKNTDIDVWVRSTKHDIHVLTGKTKQWRNVGAMGPWRMPSLKLFRGTFSASALLAEFLVLVAAFLLSCRLLFSFTWCKTCGRFALAALAVTLLVYASTWCRAASGWQAGTVTSPSGSFEPLAWRPAAAGVQLEVAGKTLNEDAFDEHGRFVFDVITRIGRDEDALSLTTAAGTWACRLPRDKRPTSPLELGMKFTPTSLPPPAGARPLFTDEHGWTWTRVPAGHVAVTRGSVSRRFAQGRWSDMIVQGMIAPRLRPDVLLLDTPAGVVVLDAATHRQRAVLSVAEVIAAEEYGVEATPNRQWFVEEPFAFTDAARGVEWTLKDRVPQITAAGRPVSLAKSASGPRLAFDTVQDFLADAANGLVWVRTPWGDQQLSLSRQSGLRLHEHALPNAGTVFQTPPLTPDVRHSGILWRRRGPHWTAQYEGAKDAGARKGLAGVIEGGSFCHDRVEDLQGRDGRLLFATPLGFVEYLVSDHQPLGRPEIEFAQAVAYGHYDRPHYIAFDGNHWGPTKPAAGPRDSLPSAQGANGAVLWSHVKEAPVPIQFAKGLDGFKFDFDQVERLQAEPERQTAWLKTADVVFHLSVGSRRYSYAPEKTVATRADLDAVFDLRSSAWSLSAAAQASGGPLKTWDGGREEVVTLTTDSGRLPWDHVDLLEMQGGTIWTYLRGYKTKLGGQVLERAALPPAVPVAWAMAVRPRPEWGALVDSKIHDPETWLLFQKRLIKMR